MSRPEPKSEYYVAQAPRLLRQFDRHFGRAQRRLVQHYGEVFAVEVAADTRERFERIIPELPYIGGQKNYFTGVIVINGWIISFYRAMNARDKSVEETVRIACEAADDFFRSKPSFLLGLMGRAAFTAPVRRAFERQAARSQQRRYKEDFVFEVTVGDGGEYDFGLNFTECAVNKFYDDQGVAELKPFCNFFDVTYSRLMGMGLDARSTIGLGCDRCLLAFKRGGKTRLPDHLKGLISEL